jgi:methanogenic corrinoid protein MtbC1
VTAEFAREIGADGYAPDAASAVEVMKAALAQ